MCVERGSLEEIQSSISKDTRKREERDTRYTEERDQRERRDTRERDQL